MYKYLFALLLPLLLIINTVRAQNSDDQFKRPLEEVLVELQKKHGVKLHYKKELVADQWVTYANWRLRNDLEKSLNNILLPLDMAFIKRADGSYKINTYEYYRWRPDEAIEKAHYLSTLYTDTAGWNSRKAELIPCMREAIRLTTIPAAPTTKPITTAIRKMNGYTVQNIALETLPGVYVCGSVYRPAKIKGKVPVMICPNGHWPDGRYRNDHQYKCAAIARMGGIAVSYDLFAWGESKLQFDEQYHRSSFAMIIQLLNTFRWIDYMLAQPQTDPTRLGITGGSGAGSHAMLVTAIDQRIKLSVPTVMLSCYMYGGCPCESGRPIHLCGEGTNNVELAAMAAPRPQLLMSDGGDWTYMVPEVEFPLVQRVYEFYGKGEMVKNAHFADEKHDYGINKRTALYQFLAEHFALDLSRVSNAEGQIDESFVSLEAEADMYVFGTKGELLPKNAIHDFEQLKKLFDEATRSNK